jgi:hypothetical protein
MISVCSSALSQSFFRTFVAFGFQDVSTALRMMTMELMMVLKAELVMRMVVILLMLTANICASKRAQGKCLSLSALWAAAAAAAADRLFLTVTVLLIK